MLCERTGPVGRENQTGWAILNTSYAWHGKNNYVRISICQLIKLRQTLITLVNKIHHVWTLCSCGLEHKHCSAPSWLSVYSEILSNDRKNVLAVQRFWACWCKLEHWFEWKDSHLAGKNLHLLWSLHTRKKKAWQTSCVAVQSCGNWTRWGW